MYDIIIVGAGTAGLTAAIYARRAAKSVLVLEAKSYGGQIINTPDIENYPVEAHISGFDFATKLYDQATSLGAEVRIEKVTEIKDGKDEKTVVTLKNTYACRALILATGSESRKLGLDGESSLVGRGVSYCATCDGSFFRGKTVAVVGGGNTALEDALYLSDIAKTVYLIHRRGEFRGAEATSKRLGEKSNVSFVLNSSVTRILADKRIERIEITNNSGETSLLDIDGLFIAVGRIPETQNFAPPVSLDGAGYIVAGEDCRTNVDGIFAAGDCRTKEVRQLVTAASDGAVAATAAVKYINE